MLFCLFFILHSPASQEPALTTHYYDGELFRKTADGFSPIDDFRLVRFIDQDGKSVGEVILQSGRERAAWSDAVSITSANPHVRHNHDGVPYKLEPVALQIDTTRLNAGDNWRDGRKQFRIGNSTEFDGRTCREVFVQEGPARNHKLLVDEKTGIVVSLQQRVFMGRGDEFRLTLEQKKPQKAEQTAADIRFFTKLAELKSVASKLEQGASRLKTVSTALPGLRKEAQSDWAKQLIKRIDSETTAQARRAQSLADMRKKALGTQLPTFELPLIAGGRISSKALTNKVTVFHVWTYRDEPLSEPYGQTAYLDFVVDKYAGKPVRFIGINIDARYADRSQVSKANRSARKLIEFMNLTYPIARDDGTLLKQLGDPRATNTELPLWIVADKDGKVRVWKTGYYDIDARSGLKELRESIDKLLK